MTTEEKHLDQKVLRVLRRHGKQKEGTLAGLCQRRLFQDSWKASVSRLESAGLVVARPTGFGVARTIELTGPGAAEMERILSS
jgi:hypothetical protein